MPLGAAETSALLEIADELAACSDERELFERLPELTYAAIGSRSGHLFAGHEQEVSEALQVIVADLYTKLARDAPDRSHHTGDLTSREREVLGQLIAGLSAQQIARRLKISAATVRKHLEHVYAKLGVHDRLTAANRAREMGLLDAGVG